jgi:hypothetical protein
MVVVVVDLSHRFVIFTVSPSTDAFCASSWRSLRVFKPPVARLPEFSFCLGEPVNIENRLFGSLEGVCDCMPYCDRGVLFKSRDPNGAGESFNVVLAINDLRSDSELRRFFLESFEDAVDSGGGD